MALYTTQRLIAPRSSNGERELSDSLGGCYQLVPVSSVTTYKRQFLSFSKPFTEIRILFIDGRRLHDFPFSTRSSLLRWIFWPGKGSHGFWWWVSGIILLADNDDHYLYYVSSLPCQFDSLSHYLLFSNKPQTIHRTNCPTLAELDTKRPQSKTTWRDGESMEAVG